jgi:signal transduction histidine kinase
VSEPGQGTHVAPGDEPMLDAFIVSNRDAIISRAQTQVAAQGAPTPWATNQPNGIAAFLDQLCEALRLERSKVLVNHDQIRETASRHGRELLRMGLTIGEVVHVYGEVCQGITALVVENHAAIAADEFRTLNLCLDDAIAQAVTVYARERERAITDLGTERLGILAHEMRNAINTLTLSFESIKSGRVAAAGSTGAVHARSLLALRALVDRSLADVRLDAGIVEQGERISVGELIEEVEIGASLRAEARGLHFSVSSVDRAVTIEGDRQVLAAAVSNLLENAFKFTRRQGNVSLRVEATVDRVLFEVEDECGGLLPGQAEDLGRPFQPRGSDRSGLGLGLSICFKAAKASGGDLHVRNLPGKGCVFTLDLPRKPPSSSLG